MVNNYFFINDNFKKEIKDNVIQEIFKNLNPSHVNVLTEYVVDIIDIIAIKFNFIMEQKDEYVKQFRQNNYRDVIGILFTLLPYIDDPTENEKKKIKSLNDIYITKKQNVDINNIEPKYLYSNVQYGRCIRNDTIEELQFDITHLEHSYNLLKQSIQIMSNKLYVNWINVRPISLKEYTNKQIFNATKTNVMNHTLIDWDPNSNNNEDIAGRLYRGLYIGDIYNVISNYLFHHIKNIKWLIYDAQIQKSRFIPYIIVVGDIFPLNDCVNNYKWNQLTTEKRTNFKQAWDTLKKKLISTNKIPLELQNRLLKALMIFFQKYYSGRLRAEIEGGYIPFDLKDMNLDDLADDIDENLEELDVDSGQLLKSIDSLSPNHLYEFIRESIQKLKPTWYFSMLVKFNNSSTNKYELYSIDNYDGQFCTQGSTFTITLKILYNYCKSLVGYIDKGRFLSYPRFWRSLTKENKNVILQRLNWDITKNYDVTSWFNIRRNILRMDSQYASNINNIHNDIINQIQQCLTNIVFEVLIKNGVLNEFIPQKELTDSSRLPDSSKNYAQWKEQLTKLMKKIVLNDNLINSKWNDSYYFLTNEPFGALPELKLADDDRQGNYAKFTSYLEWIPDDGSKWYTTYAMDWISQISFFHRYINNRIIYVTGSTGVGKSSQVPKLLLYALKMIDYKYNGKIVCTQPRISPTTSVSDSVSRQMGVPINEFNEYHKKIKTDNYYLQFKYQGDEHKKDANHLILRFVTDGTLYQELKNNPILKKRIVSKSGEYRYTDANMYDIVIVDEAHEHNKNMDLILTMMRYGVYYNNDIRLVIISATMDDDEPTYRRYYRDINDNRLYPFDNHLLEYKLDRINIDRRLHISPPGGSTRFEINEFYEPNTDPENIVLNIVNKTSDGDILLFQPGQGEIIKSVDKLNKLLPRNIIALPYYSTMDNDKKSFIESINNSKKKQIQIPREIRFDENYDEDDLGTNKVPQGTYDRVVIVATNIAEASITITTLKYVVDTGIQKTNEYNYEIRFPRLKTVPISESSRLQRKGRVGRVGPGDVYYTYKEGAMENNKTQFNIAISDISDTIFDLLRVDYNETILFNNDPNKIGANIKVEEVNQIYKFGLGQMIKKQYFIGDRYIAYYGNENHYDYSNSISPPQFYFTGYEYSTLLDQDGKFYIVHPEELCIKRNITGKIINAKNDCKIKYEKDDNKIESPKMDSFFESLREKLLIFKDTDFIKTRYGMSLLSVMQKLDLTVMDIRYIISYIYAKSYNVDNDILKLLSALPTLGSSGIKGFALSIFEDKRFKIKIDKVKNIYGNEYGDAITIINIMDKIINFVNNNIFKIGDRNNVLSQNEQNKLLEQKKEYMRNKNNRSFKNIGKWVLNKFIKMDGNGQLTLSNELSKEEIQLFSRDDSIIYELGEMLEEKENIFKDWCKQNYLNSDTVKKCLIEYIKLSNSINRYNDKNYDVDYDAIAMSTAFDIPLDYFSKMIQVPASVSISNKQEENIITSILYGWNYNIVKRMGGSQLFLDINAPSPQNVYEITPLTKKVKIPNTTLDKKHYGEYQLYLARDIETIMLINRIDPKKLPLIAPLTYKPEKYNSENFNIIQKEKELTKLLYSLGSNSQSPLAKNYLLSIRKIKQDIVNSYDSMIWDKLSKLDPRNGFIKMLNNERNKQKEEIRFIKQSGGKLEQNKINKENKIKNYNNQRNIFIEKMLRNILK